MKVLILGDDGRAHALTWKIFTSPNADVVCAPGNGGTSQIAPSVDLNLLNAGELTRWSFDETVDLVVPADCGALAAGLVDEAIGVQVSVFGPPQRAARLEMSRCNAKAFLLRHGLPTARGRPCADLPTAEKVLAAQALPVVVKPDNPGRPAAVFHERYAALEGLRAIFNDLPEERGEGVVIEEFLPGVSVSFSAITDGSTAVPLLATRTFQRLDDRPESPLAPGVGALTSTSSYARRLTDYLHQHLILPTVAALGRDGIPYWGVIGVDCIVTDQGPRITSLRTTLRDQEAQVVLPRLEDDLVPVMQAAIARRLDRLPPLRWREQASVGISLVSQGYPVSFGPGSPIGGLADVDAGVLVFHHQTHNPTGLRYSTTAAAGPGMLYQLMMGRPDSPGLAITAAGGHVLTVVALGATINGARGRALINAERITFQRRIYRPDIGERDFR